MKRQPSRPSARLVASTRVVHLMKNASLPLGNISAGYLELALRR